MVSKLSYIALAVSTACVAAPSYDDPYGPSQNDFGGVGLLQMPSARMAKEGEFSFNYMDDQEYRRWSISMQPFEWFEATLRYTDVRTRLYSQHQNFSGDQSYKDKSMDFKFRLWKESDYMPQISLGFRDLMGTGLFDSEYLVASKRYGPFDFTLGIGWGNMAQSGNIKNPFCELKDSFCYRSDSYSGSGGNFEFNNLFHGPAAIFGGIEYQTPWRPLRLKLEYDGNDYSREFANRYSSLPQSSPINIGAVYRVFDNVETHLSYQRGNTLMWGITLRTNFNDLHPAHIDEPKSVYQPQTAPSTLAKVDWEKLSAQTKSNAGYQDLTWYGDSHSVMVTGEQVKYLQPGEAEERIALLAINSLPESVKTLHVIEHKKGLESRDTKINLDSTRLANSDQPLGRTTKLQSDLNTAGHEKSALQYESRTAAFTYSLDPVLTQSIGGPESFYMYQVGVNLNGDWRITNNNWLSSTLFVNIANNFDKFNYKTPPHDGDALPRVRTWIREYVSSSDVLLNNLQATHFEQFNSEWYGQAYAGYLEMMYAGVGSELLYRPFGQSWAVGADINWVKQRDWNDTLKMAEYDVVTGHMTGYWQVPYVNDVSAKLSVGRYLAGDVGATIDLSKRFSSGVIAGVFATKTDVSSEEYGEGSFTKGIYVTIPFDLMLLHPTTNKGTVSWVPLTRDGGQMLNRRVGLYNLTSNASFPH
ncbi:TPA: YjbH domain-containing protein [Escherichia coli]|nr:YjbH domain-containing protein [Escherichia coli]EHW7470965.1 YjbH domain-containing protein [Escherichia coli]EHX8043552.1 YjbH domain-containing protein [Escherichia coli]EHX8111967.1 YjbH domain-containing protein [Escherichia coli]EHY6431050.1 YjbH domain-containing protein [Escherichia coli]EJQ7256585.1 YjbH domain-containing protein [Escherichia coli]